MKIARQGIRPFKAGRRGETRCNVRRVAGCEAGKPYGAGRVAAETDFGALVEILVRENISPSLGEEIETVTAAGDEIPIPFEG